MMVRWRTVLVLALLAVVSSALAGWAWRQARAPLAVAGQGEVLLQGLEGKLEAVAAIELRRGNERLMLRRGDDGAWRAGEAAWPVPLAQVRSVLLTLMEMRKVRPATALPERYRAIFVDDPNPDSQATRLQLKDKTGQVLADVILGREAEDWLGGGRTAQFVRLAGQRQAWLVEGHVRAPLAITDWAGDSLLKLAPEKLAEVVIERDGDSVRLLAQRGGDAAKGSMEDTTRDSVGQGDAWRSLPLRLADAPPSARPDAAGVRRLAQALEDFTFTDVRPDAFLKDDKPLARVRVKTADGMGLLLRVYHRKGKGDDAGWWITGVLRQPGKDAKMAENLKRRLNGRAFRVYDSVGEVLSAGLAGFIEAEVKDLGAPAARQPEATGSGTSGSAPTTNGD